LQISNEKMFLHRAFGIPLVSASHFRQGGKFGAEGDRPYDKNRLVTFVLPNSAREEIIRHYKVQT
jgi:hypothetical protein